jgi:hypothetical protein
MKTQLNSALTAPTRIPEVMPLYNPDGMMTSSCVKLKCIWQLPKTTRIDFIYQSPQYYVNGGWIQIDPKTYIQCVHSGIQLPMLQAIGIPLAPQKHHFKKSGTYFTYSLIFGALPKTTTHIHCIEKAQRGTYFNFYNIPFSSWIKIPHAADLPLIFN